MPSNAAPFEILAGPADVYIADAGTAFPAVDAAPAVAWVKFAAALNLTEDGVTITGAGTEEAVYSLGGTGSRKGFRTRQEVSVDFVLMDATAEAYKQVLGGNAIVTTAAGAGVAGNKAIELSMPGGVIITKALLVRAAESPYADLFASQWEFARVYQKGHPTTKYSKGVPIGLAFSFTVMDDDAGLKGKYRAQTAAAT
jgi:hypothetical protein